MPRLSPLLAVPILLLGKQGGKAGHGASPRQAIYNLG